MEIEASLQSCSLQPISVAKYVRNVWRSPWPSISGVKCNRPKKLSAAFKIVFDVTCAVTLAKRSQTKIVFYNLLVRTAINVQFCSNRSSVSAGYRLVLL